MPPEPPEHNHQAEITKFWKHLFATERGFLQVWTGVQDENGNIPEKTIRSRFFHYPDDASNAAEYALKKTKEPGRDVYFCAHLLSHGKRSKENAKDVHALWCDLDGASLPNGELKPTCVVESSPGHYHGYYGLDFPVPPDNGENLNRRLAHKIGADPSGYILTKVLRVPYTTNYKYPDHPTVRLVSREDGFRSAAKLDELLPEIEEPKTEHEPEDAEDEPPVALNPEALKVYRGENPKIKDSGEVNRSVTLLQIGRALYDAGANRRVVVEALKERDEALGYRKYTDRPDADKQYSNIFAELKGNGRTPRLNVVFGKEKVGDPQTWPEMEAAAFRGIFGHIVELADPHTEGDPVAVLASAIVSFGSALGRGPYMQVGATRHYTNLFCGIVGNTAKGRKGSTWDPVQDTMHATDRHWTEHKIASGLSSGEGLISEVRDPVSVPDKDGNMKEVDQGVSDKRLLVMEGELAQALKVIKREGNTLSPVLRNAWDGKSLRTMVKHSPLRATNPHIAILGHVTQAELIKHLTETEMASGLANRFLFLLVKRSKSLPFGGEWHSVNLQPVSHELVRSLEYTDRQLRMAWAEDARPLWLEAYELLTEDRPGMFGAVTARAEAQTLRLAMVYALAERSPEIRRHHVESALAVWQYAEESARWIFGDLIGDADADKVLAALKESEEGMTRTEVSALFGRNKAADDIERIKRVLLRESRIRITKTLEEGSKKPVERWHAA